MNTVGDRDTESPGSSNAVGILQDKNLFLVTGMGRSGTTFLAKILDSASNVAVGHEPFSGDKQAYADACRNPELAEKFLCDVRLPFMAKLATAAGMPVYGEVNSLLRRHVPALTRAVPGAKVGLIVRNGQDVVSSMEKRNLFTEKDLISNTFYLPQDHMSERQWLDLPRFQKLCWYWRIENERLFDYADFVVCFEKLLDSYSYFNGQVVERLGISTIPEQAWELARVKRENETRGSRFGVRDSSWNREKRSQFEEICGSLMGKLGYR